MALTASLPENLVVLRGQTQKNVNRTVLDLLVKRFSQNEPLQALDLPCGNMEFLSYLQTLFPNASLCGADIAPPRTNERNIPFVAMDLTREFPIPAQQQFDLVTSISGVMMFSNTLSFVRNCVARLKPGGTFVLTNDNSATILDRLAYLLLARHRMFRPVYDDSEEVTQNVPIQELIRLLRTNGITIEDVQYTSFYAKDILYLPFALLAYPFQLLYLLRLNTRLPDGLKWKMYPFRHFFGKHYIITGVKGH
ncbi:MAG TPA: methyltransferase domain-containing protein [Hymenobacter sp.]|uniref:class I SAM-dependent methyltransferase n=1 Tax=Hymenobacter sp. TaxID=1898978 RepID=UPI002ED8602D